MATDKRMHFAARTNQGRGLLLLAIAMSLGVLLPSSVADTNDPVSFPAPTRVQAQNWYLVCRSNYLSQVGNSTAAWKLADACFEWAEFATNDTQRAAIAEEGIAAARFATEMDPKNPAGHFYLAMNKGQLARTRSLGALPLVREMEELFLKSIRLDPAFEHAAAHRSLGMLYLDAPGWPASIGSKSKARKHLEKAVELSADYPTNHLALMEALLRWDDLSELRRAMARYRKLLPSAKERFSGALWQNSWKSWNSDWQEILKKVSDE